MITVSTNYSVILLYTLVTYPYIFCSDIKKEESCGSKLILLCNFASRSRLLPFLCRLFGVTIGLKEVSLAMHHGVIGKKNFAQACCLVDLGTVFENHPKCLI